MKLTTTKTVKFDTSPIRANMYTQLLVHRQRVFLKTPTMHKILFLILFLKSISLNGQTIEVENIENGSHVFSNDTIILVVGHNYRPDGYGQITQINAYNAELKLKWRYKLVSHHTNIVDRIKVFEKQIVITGLVGERDNENLKTNRFITILNLDGKVIRTKNIGASNYQCSNIVLRKDRILLCYNAVTSSLFRKLIDSSVNQLVEYNLKTNTIKTQKHTLLSSWPKHLSIIDNKPYLIGVKLDKEFTGPQFFFSTFEKQNKTTLLHKNKFEEFYKVLTNERNLTIISFSNPYEPKEKRYLRFDNTDTKTNRTSTRLVKFSELGWQSISTDPNVFIEFPSKENELWFYCYKSDAEASFTQLDNNGRIISEIKSTIIEYTNKIYFNISKDFYPTEKFIYLLHKKEGSTLKLSKIKRTTTNASQQRSQP